VNVARLTGGNIAGEAAVKSEYRAKVHEMAPPPKEIDSWEAMENPREMHRVLSLAPEDLRSKDFAFILGGGIEALYYLPYALEYLRGSKPEKRGFSTDVVNYIARHAPQLMQMGLYTITVKQLLRIFDLWSRVFAVNRTPEDRMKKGTVRGSTSLCELLCAIRNAKLPWRSGELFDYMISTWANEPKDAVLSALFLDVLLHAKDVSHLSYDLHADQKVQSLVNNRTLCQAHWRFARVLVEDHCPSDYVDLLKTELGVN
jgi:hypothetical protein